MTDFKDRKLEIEKYRQKLEIKNQVSCSDLITRELRVPKFLTF